MPCCSAASAADLTTPPPSKKRCEGSGGKGWPHVIDLTGTRDTITCSHLSQAGKWLHHEKLHHPWLAKGAASRSLLIVLILMQPEEEKDIEAATRAPHHTCHSEGKAINVEVGAAFLNGRAATQ